MINNRIENITFGILKELEINAAKKIDLEKISKYLGVDVKPEKLDSEISGLFVIKGERAYIRYNSKESEVRQRFTIAHELGHFHLHNDMPLSINKNDKVMYRNIESSTGEVKREREANSFAASLLMPKKFVLEEIAKAPKKTRNLAGYLSRIFKVSEQSMTFRLANLGYDIGLVSY